jgi:hypothetical protein
MHKLCQRFKITDEPGFYNAVAEVMEENVGEEFAQKATKGTKGSQRGSTRIST